MTSATLLPATDTLSSSTFVVEYSMTVLTGELRKSIKLSDFPRIATLKSLFASVLVNDVQVELRQDAFIGDGTGDLKPNGHMYVALIPTNKDSDSSSGSTVQIVNNVPNKMTFPLSSSEQVNRVFNFNLSGYEVDLAQDPRRGAGPVAWIGNSGVTRNGSTPVTILTATWRVTVTCSGVTPVWQ